MVRAAKIDGAPAAVPRLPRAHSSSLNRPLLAGDLETLARDAGVKVRERCNWNAAKEAVNHGILLFRHASQDAGAPGEFAAWFHDIAGAVDRLGAQFGNVGTDDRRQAIRNFEERPISCAGAKFDPTTIVGLIENLEKLRDAARAAAKAAETKKTGHRPKGTPRMALARGLRDAWRIITGSDETDISTSGNVAGDRTPGGTFIRFSGAILSIAADRMGRSPRPKEKQSAALIRDAAKPNAVAAMRAKLWPLVAEQDASEAQLVAQFPVDNVSGVSLREKVEKKKQSSSRQRLDAAC